MMQCPAPLQLLRTPLVKLGARQYLGAAGAVRPRPRLNRTNLHPKPQDPPF